MAEFSEAYRKIGDPDDRFDIEFWRKQGAKAIFDAALEMALEVRRMKTGDAIRPSLERTVESFQKL